MLSVILLLIVDAYLPAPRLSVTLPAAPYPPAQAGLPWLRTAHGGIVDAGDRTVLLRGFNVDALVSYPKDPPAPFTANDAATIQRAGFDVVRLGIDWAQLEPVRGRMSQAYLDRVAATVAVLNQHGLYVVLDMHFRLGWSPRFGYSGAPGWATVRAPDWNPLPQYSWSPALIPAAFASDTYFWLSDDWKRDFYQAWRAVAARFSENSGVAGYDIFNEAHPLPIPPRIFEKTYLWPMFQHAIEAIGAVDSNHLFFTQGILLLSLDTAMVRMSAPNLVYGTHVYEGSLVPPFWNGDPTNLDSQFRKRQTEAQALPAPLWIGELGYDLSRPEALSYVDAALDEADRLGVGWAWWQWRENLYWGIVDAAGRTVNSGALSHLARPFAIATPVGVHPRAGVARSGRVSLVVDAGHADGAVVLGWSGPILGAPATTGSCVRTSAFDAAAGRLTVELEPGAGCTVSVAPVSGG